MIKNNTSLVPYEFLKSGTIVFIVEDCCWLTRGDVGVVDGLLWDMSVIQRSMSLGAPIEEYCIDCGCADTCVACTRDDFVVLSVPLKEVLWRKVGENNEI